jgi:hypothetical protein
MKIENQYCTYAQAKKLHELGVGATHSTVMQWAMAVSSNPEMNTIPALFVDTNDEFDTCLTELPEGFLDEGQEDFMVETEGEFYNAYSVAELGEMLLSYKNKAYSVSYGSSWQVTFHGNQIRTYDTEAEARASLLLLFIREGIKTVEEINQIYEAA